MTTTVAFLGMGKMGRAMAAHIPDAGHELTVWNRTPAKAGEIDARIADTPAAAAAGAETVILMLTDAEAVQSVLFGGSGVVHGAAKHRLIIDASTIGPVASREIAVRLREFDLRYLDAPVCGSVAAATRATLTTFVGGDEEDIAQALPLLRLWSAQVEHVGCVGTGSAAKLVRNLTLGLALAGIGEALRLADALALGREVAFAALAAGPMADSASKVRNLVDARRADFTVDMLAKDLSFCLEHADLPMTQAAWSAANRMSEAGLGEWDSRQLSLPNGAVR